MNPYREADRRQRRARARARGPAGWLAALVPIAAGALAGRLAPAGFWEPGRDEAAGLADIFTRIGILLAAGVALAAYQLVVRGADRGVVDLHPILPDAWFVTRIEGVARETLGWLLGAVAFLNPLLAHPSWLAQGVAAVVLAWLAAVAVGVGVHVAAPGVGLDPRWAAILDGVRGPNPRLQAALLYAPGAALTLAGGAAMAGAYGVVFAVAGQGGAAALVLLPVGVAGVALAVGRGRAGEVARYPAILGEIEAAYAAADGGEEARHVYLDWTVRLAPGRLRRDLLRELRHLWRSQRGWAMGAWGLAALAALDAWTGGGRVGVAGVAAVGLAGARLAAEDPPWLEEWLGLGRLRIGVARAVAVWLHLQPVVLGTAVGLVRGHGVPVLVVAGSAFLLAGAAAATGVTLRGRALVAYLPIAVLTWGVTA